MDGACQHAVVERRQGPGVRAGQGGDGGGPAGRVLLTAEARGGAAIDVYLLVGNPNTRKSSVLRSLTGCFNRSVRDIQPAGGKAPLRLYARVGSLQESRTTAADFLLEVGRTRCAAVACCLWPTANPLDALRYPDALAYVAAFKAAGWRLRAIAVLGQNAGGLRSPNLRQLPQAGTQPINVTAREVRAHFGWD